MHIDTQLVDIEHTDQHHAAVEPIYQSATFHQTGLSEMGQYDYTRSGNPTRTTLEVQLAKIMGQASHSMAVNSGMAASDVICRLVKPGEEIVAGSDLYGGTSRLMGFISKNQGIIVHHVDTSSISAVEAVLSEKTKLVMLESPTNPAFNICDIPEVVKVVRKLSPSAIVAVDNTMMSPINANPFELGADIWYESATKYLSGHHDLMAGVIAVNNEEIAKDIKFVINMQGSGLAPFDSWLLLRGMKTMSVRFEKQQQNAIDVANYLVSIADKVKLPKFEVKFPGLKSLKGYEIHERTCKGPGAVLSFRTHDVQLSERIVDATKLFRISVSFGAVNSLISLPCKMSHASIDAKTRAERGFPEDIVRLCMGIENSKDLIADLEQAFKKAGAL